MSAKALRLYEQRGLVVPGRTAAGWRTYGPADMSSASEVVALRSLGLSLLDVAQILGGDSRSLGPALAAHQTLLESRIAELVEAVKRVGKLRRVVRDEQAVPLARPSSLPGSFDGPAVAFALPWPWGANGSS
ncbi:MerR family transcriptional regulator [Aurantimonas sp. VKM B-3413]|uniref:MerR family transcriptional regulator n=1 Tax=Aurantimonas sp. VKM B-3413 TaxID=2779401 RepID=UPI001E47EC67